VGYYGPQITKIAEQLLAKGMYNYVGSDVHHNNHIAAFEKSKIERFGTIKRSDSQQSLS
jgi:tyrosine-protein phosphatase YwqE